VLVEAIKEQSDDQERNQHNLQDPTRPTDRQVVRQHGEGPIRVTQ